MNYKLSLFLISIFFLNCTQKSKISDIIAPAELNTTITFNKNIKPLFSTKCSPCHTKGGDRNNKYDDFETSKTLITGIIGRIIKEPSDLLFMPKNSTKLSKAELDLVNKWIDDGLIEK